MKIFKKFTFFSIIFLHFFINTMQIKKNINPLEITAKDITIFNNARRFLNKGHEGITSLYTPRCDAQFMNDHMIGFPEDSTIKQSVQSEKLVDFKYSLTILYTNKIKNLINGKKLNNSSFLSFQEDSEHKIINTCFLNSLFSIRLLVSKQNKEISSEIDLEKIKQFISKEEKRLRKERQYYNEEEHENYKTVVSHLSSEVMELEPKPEKKKEKLELSPKQSSWSYWLPRGGIVVLIIAAILHKQYGLQNIPANIKILF